MLARTLALVAPLLLSACHTVYVPTEEAPDRLEEGLRIPVDRATGKPLLEVAAEVYRTDGLHSTGPLLSGLSSTTEVWAVTGRWYHVTDEAGPAWEAYSGLTWDAKYAAWIDAMAPAVAEDGHVTVEVTTPWGEALPAPRLECAEMAMFLRATFASWYGLPFMMTAWHSSVGDIHLGHFGIVDDGGTRVTGYPSYGSSYDDLTDTDSDGAWPSDPALAARALTTLQDDHNGFLGDDAFAGAYFDRLFRNKRVGYFLLDLLTNTGSMHVASPRNTWNLAPEAMREGDVLVQRWQPHGIGHVVVLKEVDEVDGQLDVEVMYGSMPRIQPVWYGEEIASSYLTSRYAGSGQTDASGVPYSRYDGGLKRWRSPIQLEGRWLNIVQVSDRDHYIAATDYEAIEARPQQIEALLGTLTPEERVASLEARIEVARDALRTKPASCANRTRREEAFTELYAVMEDHFGRSRASVDEEFRLLEDYVFAELSYDDSKTCCWNQTTDDMAAIVLDYAVEEQGYAGDTCLPPTVFGAEDGGYDRWEAFAAATGRAEQWLPWTEDETCPQRDVGDDVALQDPTGWCTTLVDVVDEESGCNGVTWEGECQGDTVVWCEDDQVERYSCPSHLTCDYDDDFDYFWCL